MDNDLNINHLIEFVNNKIGRPNILPEIKSTCIEFVSKYPIPQTPPLLPKRTMFDATLGKDIKYIPSVIDRYTSLFEDCLSIQYIETGDFDGIDISFKTSGWYPMGSFWECPQ